MSVALDKSSNAPDQLCPLKELSVTAQLSAPRVPARDVTTAQVNGGPGGGGGREDARELADLRQDRPGCEAIFSHGDRQCTLEKVNSHGNKNEPGSVEVGEVDEPRQQTRGGASFLRQQWARQTKPKHYVTESIEEDSFVGGGNVKGDGGEAEERVEVEGKGGGECRGKDSQSTPDMGNGGLSSHHHPNSSPDTTNTSPLSSCVCGRAPRQLRKTQSVGSISSESLTMSSLWEAPSYDTVPDFLSSLGFDDFDSPELIPDRFIPPELDFVRPSLMRQATLGSVGPDNNSPPDGLLLGATADSVAEEVTISVDQVDSDPDPPLPPQTLALYLPSKSQLPWQPASLETVVEETGSELLSPRPSSRLSARLTPHLNSPILSIDHTPTPEVLAGLEADVSTGLLGAGLAQRIRQQVLAKEDLRQRQMSLGGDSDTSSLYFSVASHFEEGEESWSGAKEGAGRGEGRDGAAATEETETGGKRRRRGNYAPPPQLLMWLEKAETTCDSDDQPWPFSETPSPGVSPVHRRPSDNPLPSITLNGNSNNNCPGQSLVCRKLLSVAFSDQTTDNDVKEKPFKNSTKLSSFSSSDPHHTLHSWSSRERSLSLS